jgi:hypothetical protein
MASNTKREKVVWDKNVTDAKSAIDRGEVRQALEHRFGGAISDALMEALHEGWRRTYGG